MNYDFGDLIEASERKSEKRKIFKETLFKSVFIPSFLIILTALSGSLVGISLQESSFRRTKYFEYFLTSLKNRQEKAADLYVNTLSIIKLIEADERLMKRTLEHYTNRLNDNSLRQNEIQTIKSELDKLDKISWAEDVEKLQHIKKELKKITILSRKLDTKQHIETAVKKAEENLDQIIVCLKIGGIRPKDMCTPNFSIETMEKVVESHSEVIIAALNK